MVDTAVFSIFHRAPPPPAPPPEPVEPVAAPPAATIVEHPLLATPAAVKHEEPSPEPVEVSEPVEPIEVVGLREPVAPEPVPHPVAEPAPTVHESAEATADHPEIPVDTAVLGHHAPAEAALAEPEASAEERHGADQVHAHEVAVAPVEEMTPEFEPGLDESDFGEPEGEAQDSLAAQEFGETAFAEELVLLPEPEPSYEPVAEDAAEAEAEPTFAPEPFTEPEPTHAPEAPAGLAAAFEHLTEAEPVIEVAEPLPGLVEPQAGLIEPHREPVEYAPIPPPPPHWTEQPPSFDSPAAPAPATAWHGPAKLTNIALDADQLGLANPIVIKLQARLKDSSSVELDASQSGIYRPQTFRAAPWSGFAYDQAQDGRTGLAAGTRILTSRGEMEVEKLLPGDTAMTLRAPALLPIAWIGKSVATAAPIWIEAGALGPNLPRRGLCVAPDQPVYVEPIPVPAARLVNGTTIRVVDTEDVDLFHVDVGKSEILFAEGVPLSSGDRTRLQRA